MPTRSDHLVALAERGRALMGRRPATTGRVRVPQIRNADGDTAEVLLYDEIGFWGTTADQFVRDLKGITAPAIDVRINSPGGEVFDGIAIYSALAGHPATVTTYVDGVAASAASFIAQAGQTRMIGQYAKMMIHNASGLVIGQAADMRAMADLLDELSGTIADIYAARSGRPAAEFADAMAAETWYGATDSVDAGLADAVDAPDSAPADRSGRGQLVRARARLTLKKG